MGFGIGTPLVTYAISLEIVIIAWSTLSMLYSFCRNSSFHLNFGRNAGSSVLVDASPPSTTRMISKIYPGLHISYHTWTCHVILTCFGSYQRCHLFTVLSILLGHKLVHLTFQFLNHRVELLLQFLYTLRTSLCRKEFLYIEQTCSVSKSLTWFRIQLTVNVNRLYGRMFIKWVIKLLSSMFFSRYMSLPISNVVGRKLGGNLALYLKSSANHVPIVSVCPI